MSVADREADIYDIFMEAEQHPTPAGFIIRAKIDRCTLERDPDAGPAAYCKVRDEVSDSELRTMRTIELSRTPKRRTRQAELEIRTLEVAVRRAASENLPSNHLWQASR